MRLDVEALEKCPCLAACASQWRQPSLFGDDTHAVGTRLTWADSCNLPGISSTEVYTMVTADDSE